MKYITYDSNTSAYVKHPVTGKAAYDSERSAKAARTRMQNDYPEMMRIEIEIADAETYHKSIERMITVKCMMSGNPVVQSINTPLCLDPSSNTYWSM